MASQALNDFGAGLTTRFLPDKMAIVLIDIAKRYG